MNTENTTQELSIEEMESLLAKKKEAARIRKEKEREEYEQNRDRMIKYQISQAASLAHDLKKFKEMVALRFEEQQTSLNEYGGLRANSKGGFSLTTNDGQYRVKRVRSTRPEWDERSTKALDLISDFLRDTVKKRDQKIYDILITFIQKNDKGELEYSKVMHLMSHRDKYTDPRWIEGLQLLQESYKISHTGYGYEFYSKNEATGQWDKIEINFTAI